MAFSSSKFFIASTGTFNTLATCSNKPGSIVSFCSSKETFFWFQSSPNSLASASCLATLLAEKEVINYDCSQDENIEFNLVYDQYYSILWKAIDAESFDSLFNFTKLIHGTGIVPMQAEDLANCKKIITQLKYMNSVFIHKEGQYDNLRKKGLEIIDYMNEKYSN